MRPDTVIFDMDGLLIDSEPLWYEAGTELLAEYGKQLSKALYEQTVGLRTEEWLEYWFRYFDIPMINIDKAKAHIEFLVEKKIRYRGKPMAGTDHIFRYFQERNFKIGLATSSALKIAHTVTEVLRIQPYLSAITSAEKLAFGKPHPEVYINCAQSLKSDPAQCICFEDSFNGLIAAKAAKMRCVIIPAPHQQNDAKWGAADLKISSLQNFNDLLLTRF